MKYLICSFIVAGMLIACGSAPTVEKIPPSKTSQTQWVPITEDQFAGRWQAVFHCSGLDYIVDAKLQLQGDRLSAVMSGQAAQPKRDVSGGMPFRQQRFDVSYSGQMNQQTGSFNLRPPARSPFPSLNGVYVPEVQQFVAQMVGRQWRNCSQMLIASPKVVKKLSQRFAVKNKRSRLSIFAYRGVFKPKKVCSKKNVAWLNDYFSSLPAKPAYRFNATPYVEHMYRDASFKKIFGKSLYEYQDLPSQVLHGQLSRAHTCEGLSQQARQNARFLQPLVTPLLNHVSLSRNMVTINLKAKATYVQWFNRNEEMLASLGASPAVEAEQAYARVASLTKVGNQYAPFILPSRINDSFVASHQKAQQQLSATIFNLRLDRHLAVANPTVNDLTQLAALPKQQAPFYNAMSTEDKSLALERINTQLQQQSKTRLLKFIEQQPRSLQGYQSVGAWRSRYAILAAQMPQSDVNTVTFEARQKQLLITTLLAQQSAATYQANVFSQGNNLTALAASVRFEKALEANLAPLLNEPQIVENRLQQARHRQQLLRANAPALAKLASRQELVTSLQSLREDYFWSKDPPSRESTFVFNAIKQRQQILAPFDSREGRYLNALYGGDFKQLNNMDAVFVEPYRRMFSGETFGAMGTILDGIAGMAGFKTNFMAGMQAELSSSSLIVPIFAVYLVDYQYKYKRCIEPSAVRFKKTTTSETVYRDGWGNYQYSVPHPDRVEFFTVNQRFAHVFKEVGLNNADSPLAQFTDSFLGRGNKQRTNVRVLLRSTRQMMNSYPCDSELIKKMEARMLSYFDNYLARKRKAKAAFFR